MKKPLSNILSQKDFRKLIIPFVIISNLIGLMIGISMGGQSHAYIESVVIIEERNYQIDPYPILNEIIITANSTNTENINFKGSTLYTDVFRSAEFELMPGESVSSTSNSFLKYAERSRIVISFQKPSEPQNVIISAQGRSRTLTEILSGLRTPSFIWESLGFALLVFIPSIILSYLVFFIAIFYIIRKQLHKTPSGKTFLIETIVPILYLSFWLTIFKLFPPITLTPVIIFTFLCSVVFFRIFEKQYQKESPEFVMLGITFLITSILFYLVYNPLVPNFMVNNQKILDVFPIFPIVLSLLSSGVFMLFIGLRQSKPSQSDQ